MKKIDIKTVLSMIETIYVNDKIQKFSITHAISNNDRLGESCERELCYRINPNSEKTDFKTIASNNGNGQLKKKVFNAFDKRIIRIFDVKENKYISVKIDLIIIFNGMLVVH